MSVTSKMVFGLCCTATISTIAYVHLKQNFDRQKLKEGVYRDIERQKVQQEMNKTMNTYNLQQQKELEKILKREESLQLSGQRLNET